MIGASVQSVYLIAHTSLTVVKTKIELDSHADTCILGDNCLIVHNHNRPVNVYGYNPKAGSKHAHIVNAAVAYRETETGHVVIPLLNQASETKGLSYHFLCLMKCCMNRVLIDEVPKFPAPIPSETTHAIQIENPF